MSKIDIAAERKNQIVRATVECIGKSGYHNFSMQDVARTAGVSKGIIHYYFLNKDDLMMSVLERVASDIESVLRSDLEGLCHPTDRIKAFLDISFDVVRNTREFYQVSMDFWTQIGQKEEVKKQIASNYVRLREICAQVISEGIERRVFRNVEIFEYSSYIIAVIDGISLQWIFDDMVFDYRKMTEEATQRILEGLLIKF